MATRCPPIALLYEHNNHHFIKFRLRPQPYGRRSMTVCMRCDRCVSPAPPSGGGGGVHESCPTHTQHTAKCSSVTLHRHQCPQLQSVLCLLSDMWSARDTHLLSCGTVFAFDLQLVCFKEISINEANAWILNKPLGYREITYSDSKYLLWKAQITLFHTLEYTGRHTSLCMAAH